MRIRLVAPVCTHRFNPDHDDLVRVRSFRGPSELLASLSRRPRARTPVHRGTTMAPAFKSLPVLLLALAVPVLAHKHHDELTEEQAHAPVDAILWLHIVLQAAVWGILFPTGMVLGLSKSRWHVPLQVRFP